MSNGFSYKGSNCAIAAIIGSFLFVNGSLWSSSEVPVEVVAVHGAQVNDEVRLQGNVRSRRYSKLSAEVDGLVTKLTVDEGDYVRKGDILCVIDSTLAELDDRSAEAAIARAEAELAEVKRLYQNAVQLSKEQVIAMTELESLEAQMTISQAEVRRLITARSKTTEILKRYQIHAPFDGAIVEKRTEEGEWIRTGGEAVVLVELDVVHVEFLVPQVYFNRLSPSTTVDIRFDAIPGKSFFGPVKSKIALGSNAARTFPVRVELSNDDHQIAPGMSARITLTVGRSEPKSALLIPKDAIVRTAGGGAFVWRLVSGETGGSIVEAVSVRLGREAQSKLELLKGAVRDGDRLVVKGNETLEAGQAVKVIGPNSTH